ncbi:MAG: PAS domain-containing protein, partial [Phycisphaerales bacterium]
IFDSSPNAILIADLQGNIRTCNLAAMDVLGCSRDQIVGRPFFDFIAVADHPQVREDMQKVVAQGVLKNIQYSALRANGSPFVVDASTGVIRGDDGQAAALVTIATDVTEREWSKTSRRLSLQILEISNQHALRTPMLRQIVLAIQEFAQCQAVGIRILDKKGNIPYEAYTGFSREFYESESPLSIHSDDCMCINVIRGQTDSTLPFYTPRGSFYMNDTTRFLATVSEEDKGRTRNICNQTGFESVALVPIRSNNDILGLIHLADSREHRVPLSLVEVIENVAMQLGVAVQRALAEEALQRSEQEKSLILNSTSETFAYYDTGLRIQWANKAMEKAMNLPLERMVGRRCYELRHDRTAPCEGCPLVLASRTGKPQEAEIHAPDGKTLFLRGYPLLDDSGRVVALVEIGEDITDRKHTQQALTESEERYRLLFDQMLSGLALHEIIYDAVGNPVDYRFLSVNAAFERMTGLRAGEILGRTVLEVMPGIERFWIERYGRVASTGEPVRFEDFSRVLNRYFDVRAYSPRQGQFATVFHDITEQKQAEQRAEQRQAELLHVSRLSTLGELASGLAHELNQPLSAIMSFASACLRSVQKNDFDAEKLAANLAKIVAQSGRAGDIIRRIRAFSQRRPPKFESVDVNESIREVLGLLHANLRYAGVEVVLELACDLPPILGDTVQLEQVLVNLMRNAIEAMEGVDPQRRRLTVRTTARGRDSVAVTVSDTGPGMDEKAMSQVFDPFFTTKENGLGIGLSISRSIVESHRGHLSVAPGPECGCAFTFTLPTSGARDGPAEPQAG